jgi:Pyridoxamine 5'-phosphate oxidase
MLKSSLRKRNETNHVAGNAPKPFTAMSTWEEFAAMAPELAGFGASRFEGGVAYLATITADGGPRVHPVTPIIGFGRLFLFMEPTSPKGHDLKRSGRYAIHSSVGNSEGDGGEFFVSGQAKFVTEPDLRALAVQASSYKPKDRYVLFELSVDTAASTIYEDGNPLRVRWAAEPTVKK